MIMFSKSMARSYLNDYNFTTWKKRRNPQTAKLKSLTYCDDILTFDIETTSCYLTPDGKIEMYDYNKSEAYYRECEKIGFMYIWQFAINDFVMYGRTWEQFGELLEILASYEINFTIWVHNLGFEFQFLRNCVEFERVFARKPRKTITAECMDYITFRDSYTLVNLSLEKWADQKNLPVSKAVGQLDYNIMRTPKTPLTLEELDYCKRDLLIMYHGLKEYREKYGHIQSIPLTQTGEVRREVEHVLKPSFKWRKKQAALMPKTLKEYNYLLSCYFGGDCHANYKLANKLLHGVTSGDFASSYPWVMISRLFPIAKFLPIQENRGYYMRNPDYSYIVTVEVINLKSKLDNTFLSRSRCIEVLLFKDKDGKYIPDQIDNGRIRRAQYIKATFTNIDFEMLLDFYEYDSLEILDFKISKNGYLNGDLRRYILELYGNKTTLKNIPEQEPLYMKSKQYINSLYGMSVTRDFTDEVFFSDGWEVLPTTEESYLEQYKKKQRRFDKITLSTQIGIFITAYARMNLWRGMVAPLDKVTAYFDTDSCKFVGNNTSVFRAYNKDVEKQYNKLAKDLKIDISAFKPKDKKGIEHPIGQIDIEYIADDFKTLGAKKYCYSVDGQVYMTVSGVPKRKENIPDSVADFNDGMFFPPRSCGKLISNYTEEQTELIMSDGYIMRDKYGICLQPTGYSLGLTLDYATLLLNNVEHYSHNYDDLKGVLKNE